MSSTTLPSPTSKSLIDRRELLASGAVGLLGCVALPHWNADADAAQPFSGKKLIIRGEDPPNAEPALENLLHSWITPIEYFYVRSHAPTPELDASSFRVSVEGLVERPASFTVAQLKEKFARRSALATLTCAGNRRNEHSAVKKVGGVQWDAGPIGNARWGGTALSDILSAVGVKSGAKHVWFESVDRIEKNGKIIPFGASIPLETALRKSESSPIAMVADEMNGKPLPPDHGFPMRTVVPGYIGARSVKWLGKIIVSDQPSPNHYLANAYKLVTEGSKQEWAQAKPIYQFPINSAICTPEDNATLQSGVVSVAGYALPSGVPGVTVRKVELSTDNGRTWAKAALHKQAREFCWRLWRAKIKVNKETESILVRATDSSGATQPATVKWNLKGYLFNAWHRVPIKSS